MEYEIIEKLNVSKVGLTAEFSKLKIQTLDYLIVIFSGNGGQAREALFELNSCGEFVAESALKNLANRQLNIFDCCQQLITSIRS